NFLVRIFECPRGPLERVPFAVAESLVNRLADRFGEEEPTVLLDRFLALEEIGRGQLLELPPHLWIFDGIRGLRQRCQCIEVEVEAVILDENEPAIFEDIRYAAA